MEAKQNEWWMTQDFCTALQTVTQFYCSTYFTITPLLTSDTHWDLCLLQHINASLTVDAPCSGPSPSGPPVPLPGRPCLSELSLRCLSSARGRTAGRGERMGSAVRVTPPTCLFSLRGNEKVAHWGMTVCLINEGHLGRERRGRERRQKNSADSEGLF